MFFRFFHRKWAKTTGDVIDARLLKRYPEGGSKWAYVVQFVGPDGKKTKLEVRSDPYTEGVGPGIMGVPLLVSPDGKKAVFDRYDPKINRKEVYKREKQAEEERFRENLEE